MFKSKNRPPQRREDISYLEGANDVIHVVQIPCTDPEKTQEQRLRELGILLGNSLVDICYNHDKPNPDAGLVREIVEHVSQGLPDEQGKKTWVGFTVFTPKDICYNAMAEVVEAVINAPEAP